MHLNLLSLSRERNRRACLPMSSIFELTKLATSLRSSVLRPLLWLCSQSTVPTVRMLFGPTHGTFLAKTLASMLMAWKRSECGMSK
jgi:hypothetical protein